MSDLDFIRLFQISTSSIYKPAIVIDAGVHAREWVAPAVAMYIMKKVR